MAQTPSSTNETPSGTNTATSSNPTPKLDGVVEKKVAIISSKSQFDMKINEAGNKLVIVEFYAEWCGPCKIIGTKLEELALKYEDKALIIKLDVDECEDIAIEYNVTSMPTFVFLRNKKKINQLIGSNGEKLIENVEKFCMESSKDAPDFKRSSTSTVAAGGKKLSATLTKK